MLEIGGAELARARRYERSLAVVALTLKSTDERSLDAAAMTLEAVLRTGTDRLIDLGEGNFLTVLPETALSGAMHMAARLQQRLLEGGLGTRVGFAALEARDMRFPDLVNRAGAMIEDR